MTANAQPTILFSSSLGFNPGDEVILLGIERLLALKGIGYNKRIYNRNPETRHQRETVLTTEPPADYVIFAGTPEWSTEFPSPGDLLGLGDHPIPLNQRLQPRFLARYLHLRGTDRRNDPLLQHILQHDLRCAALGVGSSKIPTATAKISRILEHNTDLLITRDSQTAAAFAHHDPVIAPCPAFFCATDTKPRQDLKCIAMTLQAPHSNLIRMDRAAQRKVFSTLRQVEQLTGPPDIICHNPHDAQFIHSQAPHLSIHTVRTGAEMLATYKQYDAILSTRLHGCATACSLGIPTFQLAHGLRMDTLRQFPVANHDNNLDAASWLRSLDPIAVSQSILAEKAAHQAHYLKLLDALPDRLLSSTPAPSCR